MNLIVSSLAKELGIRESQIQAVLDLLEEGATIPFIARYRKEKTGNLDEDQIKAIEEQYAYQENLQKRKEDVMRLIEEKGLLTDELKASIEKAGKLSEVEDLYRPFKEKKKTKASAAIAAGLQPLAQAILAGSCQSLEDLAKDYISENVPDTAAALQGAGYIIAEQMGDDPQVRQWLKASLLKTGKLASKQKKDAVDERGVYKMYYDFAEPVSSIRHFRVLAVNRAEAEKILTVTLDYEEALAQAWMEKHFITKSNAMFSQYLQDCIKDALKRLILPSVKREIRSDLTADAQKQAIDVFSSNLEHLLLTRPIKHTRVLGFDPAYRTGCKLAVLDESGAKLDIAIIHPTPPDNDFENSRKKLLELIDRYQIGLIAIGNGTASRESEAFVAKVIHERPGVKYAIVSEAGASVYSASELAKEEFPELTVEKRSAISIGRRIQDPLSELVKIDPKSIGVGEYQHDVNQKQLSQALDFTTDKVVNQVGVNINTASASILSHVAGLNKTTIKKLLAAKSDAPITSRAQIKEIKGISDKVYEQCIGFLRVPDSQNPLDNTGIHPESYALTARLLKMLGLKLENMNTKKFKDKLSQQYPEDLAMALNSDAYTIADILKELQSPGLDPRDELEAPVLKSDILDIKDLKPGMELQGTVRNVASFGAFVDIGLHDDGLIHVSRLAKRYVKNPANIVHVGQIVTCYVYDVDLERNRVQLSLVK